VIFSITGEERTKLPGDAQNPLFALSMQRRLRRSYTGEYFKYREGDNEYTFPDRYPGANAYLVEIYDQKAKFGYEEFNAVQYDHSKQPKIIGANGVYSAEFKHGDYMDLIGNPAQYVSKDFTITLIGDGDFPRPMVSVYGENDSITVEPGTPTRFTFNSNSGSISDNSSNRVNQLFSGIDASQNGERVILMKSDEGGRGQNLSQNTSTDFTHISIGRAKDRYFIGSFIECTFHLGDLSRYGASKIWEEAKIAY
jgi:hypothetical protein